MKKILILVMQLCILISLCACGNSAAVSSVSVPETLPQMDLSDGHLAEPTQKTEPESEVTPEAIVAPEPERKVYDHASWVMDDAAMLSEDEHEMLVDMVESWYMDYGYKIAIATTISSPSDSDFSDICIATIQTLETAMETDGSEPYLAIVFSSAMANSTYAGGSGRLTDLLSFASFPSFSSSQTAHDAMLEYIDSMDKYINEIDFNETVEIALPEMDNSEPTVSNADAMEQIMELDVWNEPVINKCMEYDPESGVWSETDQINVYLTTKTPSENCEGVSLSLSFDESTGYININAVEQNPALQGIDKYGNPLSEELLANGGLDENGVYAGVSGYSYETRQLIKEIFGIVLPGAGDKPYELLKDVFHSRSYESNSCNPSVIRWIDGHYLSIELNTTYNNICITIGPDGDAQPYEALEDLERLDYQRIYDGVFGADKFVVAYELDEW